MTRFPRIIPGKSVKRAVTLSAAFLVTALSAALPHAALQAQTNPDGQPTIRFRGKGDIELDIFIRNLLASRDYLLITRDTVITRTDTVRGNVLVVGATLRLDGALMRDLTSIGGNVFVRPSANVIGEIRNIAGGYYPSQLAKINPAVVNAPNAPYEIIQTPGALDIVGTLHPSAFDLPGIMGLAIPTYDRVNGLTLGLGANINLPRIGIAEPVLRAWGAYYSHRGDFGGGAELGVTRRRTFVGVGAERTTITNERWIRKDLSNSIAMILQGKDYRNYYAADRAYARLDRTLEDAARLTRMSLVAQVEDASPLRAGAPWSFLKPDTIRPNDYGLTDAGIARMPTGRITSGIASIDTRWTRSTSVVKMMGLLEAGFTPAAATGSRAEGIGSPFDKTASFLRYEIRGDVAVPAIRDHTLRVEWNAQGPLPGTDSLPYQRWSYVGGTGTLPTFQTAAFPGDRVVALETRYTVPLPHSLVLPLLGRPGIDFIHYTAMGWSLAQKRRFEQNVGVQLGYRIAYVRFVTDPRNFGDKVKTTFGLTLPRSAYPWETAADTVGK